MADIILKNRDGDNVNYDGVTVIQIPGVDENDQFFVNANPVDTTIQLDFKNGDMEVLPGDSELFNKVTIPKPDTLIPENIAEGVEIAGIVGKLAAGGTPTVLGRLVGSASTNTSSIALFTKAQLQTIGFPEAFAAGKKCFIFVMAIDPPSAASMRMAYAMNFLSRVKTYASGMYCYKSGSSYVDSQTGTQEQICFGETSAYQAYPCYRSKYQDINWYSYQTTYKICGRYYAICGYIDE